MKRMQTLTKVQLIRLSPALYRDIEDTSAKLGLSASEITRRCIRTALPILKDLNLPGTQRREEQIT